MGRQCYPVLCTLLQFRKLVNRRYFQNSIPADSPSSSLMFLMNTLSGNRFLVDTGASLSVFSHHSRQPVSPAAGVQLRTADGTMMYTFGSRRLALQFGSRRFDWNVLLADVYMPVLSADFLCEHHLLVDVAGSRLLDALEHLWNLFPLFRLFLQTPRLSCILHYCLWPSSSETYLQSTLTWFLQKVSVHLLLNIQFVIPFQPLLAPLFFQWLGG